MIDSIEAAELVTSFSFNDVRIVMMNSSTDSKVWMEEEQMLFT